MCEISYIIIRLVSSNERWNYIVMKLIFNNRLVISVRLITKHIIMQNGSEDHRIDWKD
jgi:hypothetical protein